MGEEGVRDRGYSSRQNTNPQKTVHAQHNWKLGILIILGEGKSMKSNQTKWIASALASYLILS